MEPTLKHLELIQAVVTRLAGNSFTIKGWSITLVSALLALSAKDSNSRYALLAVLPALCFWGLDAYYLRQERLFRKLYDAIRTEVLDPVKRTRIAIDSFSMNTLPVAPLVKAWRATLLAETVGWLHGPILAAVLAVAASGLMRK